MTAVAGDIPDYEMLSVKRDRVLLCADQTIGAAGAVGALVADDPGFTCAKNAGTGVYDLVFPKAIRATIDVSLFSPAGTVKTWWLVAMSASAGTAQIAIGNGGGTATNPASSDVLGIVMLLDKRSDS